jgi:hypothetical protein
LRHGFRQRDEAGRNRQRADEWRDISPGATECRPRFQPEQPDQRENADNQPEVLGVYECDLHPSLTHAHDSAVKEQPFDESQRNCGGG